MEPTLSGESLKAKFDRLALVRRAAEREARLCQEQAAELVLQLLAEAGVAGARVEATDAGVLVEF